MRAELAALAVGFAASLPFISTAAALANPPRVDYLLHCAGCHGADGGGVPSVGVPPLDCATSALAQHAEGRAYLVQVPGVAQSALGDAELAALLTWVVEHFGGQPRVPAFSRDEVARLRVERPNPLRGPGARVRAVAHSDCRDAGPSPP